MIDKEQQPQYHGITIPQGALNWLQYAKQQAAAPKWTRTTSYITGSRFHGLKEFLHKTAYHTNVILTITDQDRGWIRETIYYMVEGTEEAIQKFSECIVASITAHKQR